jgi:hypothetical protein
MSPNIRRFLPLLVVAAAILFIIPTLTKKKHNSSASSKTAAAATTDAMRIVTNSEGTYLAAHGRYTSHLADLVALSPRLAADLSAGVTVALDVATVGRASWRRCRVISSAWCGAATPRRPSPATAPRSPRA